MIPTYIYIPQAAFTDVVPENKSVPDVIAVPDDEPSSWPAAPPADTSTSSSPSPLAPRRAVRLSRRWTEGSSKSHNAARKCYSPPSLPRRRPDTCSGTDTEAVVLECLAPPSLPRRCPDTCSGAEATTGSVVEAAVVEATTVVVPVVAANDSCHNTESSIATATATLSSKCTASPLPIRRMHKTTRAATLRGYRTATAAGRWGV